jgi:hypothetical protein
MREYGQVQSAFWQSPDAQACSDTGKLLALYLLTGPHANGIGCYRLPDGYVMADLGWSNERVSEGFQELSAIGFANRFDGVVFIPNFLRWNRIANGNIAKARFGEFDQLPKGGAKYAVARAMLEFCQHWTTEDRNLLETVSETVSERYANQNPTQPNPERTQREPSIAQQAARSKPNRADRFPEFWTVYPVKKGRAIAEAKWRARGYDAIADRIIEDVKRRKASDRQWLDGYAPHGSTYINGRGWEDEIEPARSSAAETPSYAVGAL